MAMNGIDQQVHKHLVYLLGKTSRKRYIAIFLYYGCLISELIPDNVECAFHAFVYISFPVFKLVVP